MGLFSRKKNYTDADFEKAGEEIYNHSLDLSKHQGTQLYPASRERWMEFQRWVALNIFDDYADRLSIEMGWVTDKLPKNPDGYSDLDSLNERQTLKILVMGEVWEYCKQNNLLDQTEIFYRIYNSAFQKGKLFNDIL